MWFRPCDKSLYIVPAYAVLSPLSIAPIMATFVILGKNDLSIPSTNALSIYTGFPPDKSGILPITMLRFLKSFPHLALLAESYSSAISLSLKCFFANSTTSFSAFSKTLLPPKISICAFLAAAIVLSLNSVNSSSGFIISSFILAFTTVDKRRPNSFDDSIKSNTSSCVRLPSNA